MAVHKHTMTLEQSDIKKNITKLRSEILVYGTFQQSTEVHFQ